MRNSPTKPKIGLNSTSAQQHTPAVPSVATMNFCQSAIVYFPSSTPPSQGQYSSVISSLLPVRSSRQPRTSNHQALCSRLRKLDCRHPAVDLRVSIPLEPNLQAIEISSLR